MPQSNSLLRFVISTLILLVSCAAQLHSQTDTLTMQFIEEVNRMRQDPKSFLDDIDSYVLEWRSFVKNKKELDKAAKEIKAILKKQSPLPPYAVDSSLMKAALQHATDCRMMGVVGHIGSDGSNPLDRAQRFSNYEVVSEAITYGQPTAAEMLAAFLIDHDSPERGHRTSMLSTELTLIGVAVDTHPTYRIQCVVDLAAPTE